MPRRYRLLFDERLRYQRGSRPLFLRPLGNRQRRAVTAGGRTGEMSGMISRKDLSCFERQVAENDLADFEFRAGVVDIDADEVARCVVVENYAIGNLAALDAVFVGKIDV